MVYVNPLDVTSLQIIRSIDGVADAPAGFTVFVAKTPVYSVRHLHAMRWR